MTITLIKMPYTGSRNVPELSPVPDYLDDEHLHAALRAAGAREQPATTVQLDPNEQHEYGTWHRMGLANAHLASIVAAHVRRGRFPVGLLGNCTSLLGMLAGLQRAGDAETHGEAAAEAPRTVGLLFLDAHADFNTPETTLSGMLGGMPVAVAAGLCLHNLRRTSRLDPPLSPDRILLAGIRDVDPQEQKLIDDNHVPTLTVEDLRTASPRLHDRMQHLSRRTDAIYVHIDMDVLDPAEVPGHHTPAPGGLKSQELTATIREIFAYEKTAALGIASTPPPEKDPAGRARTAAHRLIEAAVTTVTTRAGRIP